MQRLLPPALIAAALIATPAFAADLTVQNAWSRPAQAGMNGVGFMTIVNSGKKPVKLVSVETSLAGKAELHQSSMTNGVMTMRRLDQGVIIAPGGKLELASGGYHLMLLGLKQPLKVGQKAPVTLIFEKRRRIAVDLTVRIASPQSSKGSGSEHHHH